MLTLPFHRRSGHDRVTAPVDEEGDAHTPKLNDLARLAAEAGQCF
jgi:hypothetical protein